MRYKDDAEFWKAVDEAGYLAPGFVPYTGDINFSYFYELLKDLFSKLKRKLKFAQEEK